MTTIKRKRRASPKLPGYSPAQFAKKKNTTEHVVRSAIRSGFLATVPFNGQDRISPRELDRWDEIWGSDSSATT